MRIFLACIVTLLGSLFLRAQELPVVYVSGTPGDSYSEGEMSVWEDGRLVADAKIRLKIHGASARRYDKKSINVKVVDGNGDKLDVELLGMRCDNSWYLDAMAIDKARMRNRVAFDIWNECSSPSYVAAYESGTRNGIRGRFVELWLNGDYNGIYCLNEKIDRKQLKLKKRDGDVRGLLFKALSWYGTQYWDYEEGFDSNSAKWMGWESVYPDTQDDGPTDWTLLADNTRFVIEADHDRFCREAAERFDLPVIRDYILFYHLIEAQDNAGKNQFAYFYNIKKSSRQGLAPWDMDATFGRTYNGEELPATTEIKLNNLYYRLLYELPGFADSVKQRYAELRQSAFDATALKERFERYFSLFRESGAAKRETERWNNANGIELDFEREEQYISDWIDRRLAHFDAHFHYTVGISENAETAPPVPATVYTLSGQRVSIREAQRLGGIYIVGGRKILF